MENHNHLHDDEAEHPPEDHFHIKDSTDFDHQIWCCELMAGEAMSETGATGQTIMLSGHEYINEKATDEHKRWVFIINDPMDLLRFWYSVGEHTLNKEIWTKIVAILDA